RDGLRSHAAALRAQLAAEPWLEGLGLAAIVVFALMRLRFSPLLNFEMFGPWRYWADGLEIADAGRVPHQTLQWGAAYTPTVSKVILNSYQAGMSYLIGSAPLPAMGALLWVASVGLAVAAGSHGMPAFVFMLGLGCYAVALLLIERGGASIVRRLLGIAAVTVVVWGAALGLSGGDVGFQGAGGSNRYAAFGEGVD